MSVFRRLLGINQADDNLRIVITRHGERADLAIGKHWASEMQRHGRRDPRIPRLTPRSNFQEWEYDSPLTVDGERQSASIGRKLLALGYPIDYCYSSPAYRSIQTANKILESQNRQAVPINIEPGLFECPAWYTSKPLIFLPPENIARDRRFNINTSYVPIYKSVDPTEDERRYYRRSRSLISDIIRAHKYQGGTVLLSAHGGSIEAVSRGLRGFRHRRERPEHLIQEALRVDYCNFAILERDARTREWTVRLPEAQNNPHGATLSMQSIIPLYGVSTQHITQPTAAQLPVVRGHGRGYAPGGGRSSGGRHRHEHYHSPRHRR